MIDENPLRPSDAPSGIYGRDGRPQFFDDPALDRFTAVAMNLASELWVQEERLRTLEALAGSLLSDPVPDEDVKMFIDRIFAPLREDSAT